MTLQLSANDDAAFVGCSRLIEMHRAQIHSFDVWAQARDWASFHANHYDWWTFPIDKPSSHGFAFTVYQPEITELHSDLVFMERHGNGADLLLLSWGWDAQSNQFISNPEICQNWANWPIRLAKCARSMWLFGQEKQYESCVAYANYLKSVNTSFAYNGRDLFNEIVAPTHD